MKFFRRLMAKNRIRLARRRVAKRPAPRTYLALAQEYAVLGASQDVLRTCQEALELFPGHSELMALRSRAVLAAQEARLAVLKRELSEAPRPALWREMCEILLESGRLARAEKSVAEWQKQSPDTESLLMLAQVRVERFLTDRGREEGLRAIKVLDEAAKAMPNDARVWRLRFLFMTKLGAWREAQQCVEHLLQLAPGEPTLEAQYRSLEDKAAKAPSVDRALITVERTGQLVGDQDGNATVRKTTQEDVRPALRKLVAEDDVDAAMYVRGSTAIVLGPRGATAERTARAIRSVISSGRTTGRRLALGQVFKIQLEGEFGTLAIAPGEMDASAILSPGPISPLRDKALMELAGLNADTPEEVTQ